MLPGTNLWRRCLWKMYEHVDGLETMFNPREVLSAHSPRFNPLLRINFQT